MQSIIEVSKELKVSTKTIQRWIKKLSISAEKTGRYTYLNKSDVQKIKEAILIGDRGQGTQDTIGDMRQDRGHRTGDSVPNGVSNQLIQTLQDQISKKDEQIANLQRSLDQQQQLALLEKQENIQLKDRIKELESLRQLPEPEEGILPTQEWLEDFEKKVKANQEALLAMRS